MVAYSGVVVVDIPLEAGRGRAAPGTVGWMPRPERGAGACVYT